MIKLQRIIIESWPIKPIINWSKKVVLPGFEGIPLYDVIVFFIKQTKEIGLNERAASVAFNFLMAIPPLFIFLFTTLSLLPDSRKLYKEILILLKTVVPDNRTYTMIKNVTDDFFSAGTGTLSFGLLLALYFGSNATITLMRTFRKSMLHIELENRNFIQIRLAAIRLTFIIVLLIIATILIMFTQNLLIVYISDWLQIKNHSLDWVIAVTQVILTFSLIFFAIGMIYRHAPHVQKKWKIRTPGSIVATVLIILFSYLFSYWVNNIATYNKVYGSLGSILILMFLVFVNSLVLLIGFELNVSINSIKSISEKRNNISHE
ncbi:MAG: hypothetical protein RLY11_70 [Bacteroidota bacterium]|jgi:membrane protein